MTRVAAIDCGTNSVRLLVADVEAGAVRDLHREVRIVRLGEGVDRDRRLRPVALERTRSALRNYAATISDSGAQRVRLVATSAVRDVPDASGFVEVVHAELGIAPDVLTGVEEARLVLTGARLGVPGRATVLDVGGGSTELVHGDGDAVSLDVGSVRLTERHLRAAPATAAAVAAARADVLAELGRGMVPDGPVVGVAATVLTVVALARGVERLEPGSVHGLRASVAEVAAVSEQLLSATRAQIVALPAVLPGREDVIAAGALVLHTVLDGIGAEEVTASERDLLDGVALGLA